MANIKKRIRKLFSSPTERSFTFYDVGFHGDQHLISFITTILDQCKYFVETGTNVGSSIAHAARISPETTCFSCEPDPEAFKHALDNTSAYNNVQIFNQPSLDFLKELTGNKDLLNEDTLFWLDAHGYGFEWPLRQETEFIMGHWKKAYIFVDDFLVPGLDCFGYDEYKGQICSYDYIKTHINREFEHHLYYPQYSERTSAHHPLRGWGLIEFGHTSELELSTKIQDLVRKEL